MGPLITALGRWLLFAFALVLMLPGVLLLCWVGATSPVSVSGWVYLVGLVALTVGLLARPFGAPRRWPKRLIQGALLLLVITGTSRCLVVGSGAAGGVRLETWPDPGSARILDRLISERDLALLGLAVLPHVGAIYRAETRGVKQAFVQVYDEIDATYGALPSPFAATWLGLQRPTAFDVLRVAPVKAQASKQAVVFLHGFAGNYVFECHLLARTARGLGLSTICPSTGVAGEWWRDDGPAILEATMGELHRQGVREVVLAGLSNGAVGAARLARRIARRRKGWPRVRGVLLLFGGDPGAVPAAVPTLVIGARGDRRVSQRCVRGTASRAPRGRLVMMRGDHFAMAKRPDEVARHVRPFLRRVLRAAR